MMTKLDVAVAVDHAEWKKQLPKTNAFVKRVLANTAHAMPMLSWWKEIEISVLLTDDATIQNLNKNYRKKDKPTNVLSFPGLSGKTARASDVLSLGDIVMAYETTAREAKQKRITLARHTEHLLIHGMLHLLGYDHVKESDAYVMEGIEKVIMKLRITN